MDISTIRDEVSRRKKSMVTLRRDLHAHPELGFQERRTAGIVAERLRQIGLQVTTGVAETGVIAVLHGEKQGHGGVIMVRADMDALPLQEENDVEYRSTCDGVMHACGHDGHVAMGLTAAEVLAAHRDQFGGIVKFVFQPAEEGGAGAHRMIQDGAIQNPDVETAIGLHLWNELPVGQVGIRSGPVLASADHFQLTLRGAGGHGAAPHQTCDPIVAASQVINALQSIVSRNVNPIDSAVISVCSIHGGSTYNIIPERVELQGTVRAFKESVRQTLQRRMRTIIDSVADAFAVTAELEYVVGYPPTVNDESMCRLAAESAAEVLAPESVVEQELSLGAEDMAYFLRERPGCFLMIGSRNDETGLNRPHHNPRFNFDEAALTIGAEVLVATVLRYLREQ